MRNLTNSQRSYHKYSGKLITFEGGESCGKSLQSNLLKKYLSKKGYNVIKTREPGGIEISEKIRNLILNPENEKLESITEIFLFSASRTEFCKRILEPNLLKGNIIISDRFYDSTIAYQGYGNESNKQNLNFIKEAINWSTGGIIPDLTFLIDMDPIQSLEKAVTKEFGRKDRIESKPLSYHINVRKGFLKIAEEEPERVRVIKYLDREIMKMHKEIIQYVHQILKIK